MRKSQHRLLGANGSAVEALGVIDLLVTGNENTFNHTFVIVEDLVSDIDTIVGWDLQTKLGISISNLPGMISRDDSTKGEVRTPVIAALTISQAIEKLEMNSNKEKYLDEFRSSLKNEVKELLDVNMKLRGFCSAGIMEFRTRDDEPVSVKQYEIAHVHRPTVDKQIDEWLDNGTIEKVDGYLSYNNPLLVVPKYNAAGSIKAWRVCVDPRKINEKIIDSTYPLPLIRDIFDKLAGKRIFSVIDLKSGFNQIKIKEGDRKKTAFTWKGQTYQFVGSPFGFKNIPSDFQRIMANVLFVDMRLLICYDLCLLY